MGILSWIIVGLIAGWIAGLMMKSRGFGVLGNIVIGILGGLIGGWAASALFKVSDPITGINLETILVSILGSILLIAVIRLISGRRAV